MLQIASVTAVTNKGPGAGGRTRTGMVLLPRDFKSLASTSFATPAALINKEKPEFEI